MALPLVFLLGTQRSGTTWLANIFDSSPECVHYYEPFAPAYRLFPYFPDEFQLVTPPAASLSGRLRADLPRLASHRSKLFDPVHVTRQQFEFEARVMEKLETAYRRLHLAPLRFAAQFNLLHLNRIGQEPVAFFEKRDVRVTAVKEVRLYFKAAFLADTFPDAKFIHVVRHPAAVVSSMDQQMKRGRLVEIKESIHGFVPAVRAQGGLAFYESVLARVRDGNLFDSLAAYWRVANEELARQLAGVKSRALSLTYEDLATDPLARVGEMFEWCGLPMASATDEYVRASSTSSAVRRTVLDTNRVSAAYYRDWVGKASPEVLASVDRICSDSPLVSRFAPFYSEA